MATEPSPQRAYRAACPNCGAPVEFRSAASAFAVCSFCQSQVVRDGDALRRIGKSAELFDDHSPLQLGASGRSNGVAFTLVGRLQYRSDEGTWNEWHALFDTGRSAWLSEDNGRYVLGFDQPAPADAPALQTLRAGAALTLAGQRWNVASVVQATLIAAQGELPAPPATDRGFTVVDLRNPLGEVGTLDDSGGTALHWSVGRSVALSELAMRGLAEPTEKRLTGRSLACPACGNAVEVKLSTTQSVVCAQCQAVIDVSGGIGGDLAHYAQETGSAEPPIPLGSVGTLALPKTPLPWQVVGYAERCDVPEPGDDEETTFWREYLLYHRSEGFAFLVDADDGWSWVAPITGVPDGGNGGGDTVRHAGVSYVKQYSYTARVTHVLGEFYWRVTRDQETFNTDYRGGGPAQRMRLNREEARSEGMSEVVWSAGETLDARTILAAFALKPEKLAALQRDSTPAAGGMLGKAVLWGAIALVLIALARCGEDDDCDAVRNSFGAASLEYQECTARQRSGGLRSGGGSFGGFSTGGGHK